MIKEIGQKDDCCKECLGGKGYNLNILKQEGFKVPKGYIIPVEAFDEFLKYNEIDYNTDEYLGFNAQIQSDILHGKIQPKLEAELIFIINEMKNEGGERFVVRSSAICEDNEDFSMAGMFESYVALSSFEDIEAALKKCYASLFSDRVLNFLFEKEIGFDSLKMAAVFQEYVPGRVSGVTFTADTIKMDSNIVSINAVEGECAGFVSGRAKSQIYKVNKTNKEYILENQNGNILEDAEVKKLLELSLKIEKTMGYFQDIEWTIYKDEIYVLQSRAITTYKDKNFPVTWNKPGEVDYTWYRFYDEPLYPLMQDVIDMEINSMSKGAERTVFRIDTYAEGQVINGFYYARSKELEDKDKKRKVFVDEVTSLFDQGKNIYDDVILPQVLEIIKKIEELKKCELNKTDNCMESTKAIEYLQLSVKYLQCVLENHWPAVHGNMFIDIFKKYVDNLIPDLDTENYYDLIWSESIAARERRYLIEMSDIVKDSAVLSKLFDECSYETIIYERLKNLEEGKELMEKIHYCQLEYKYCDAGMDYVLHPTMGDRPDYVVYGINNMLATDSSNFYASMNKTKENKQRLINEIENKLSEEELIDFRKKLRLAESSFLTNDNHNYYVERMYRGFLYLAVKEAAKVLCKKKVIQLRKDINYLHIDEICELLINPRAVDNMIVDRRELYKRQLRISAPEILGTMPNWQRGGSGMPESSTDKRDRIVIKATPGLNKVVKGKIVRGMPHNLEENSIILLPHCHYDGLMKIIGKVKGLIFNWGSPYDHLGIIAREMNIPAMYNAKDAMALLKDGDMVELDGINGEIRVC